jgi:hypothetical protein
LYKYLAFFEEDEKRYDVRKWQVILHNVWK